MSWSSHKPFFKRLTSRVTVSPNFWVRMHLLACNIYSHVFVRLFFYVPQLKTIWVEDWSSGPTIVASHVIPFYSSAQWVSEDKRKFYEHQLDARRPDLKPKYMATCYLPQKKVEIFVTRCISTNTSKYQWQKKRWASWKHRLKRWRCFTLGLNKQSTRAKNIFKNRITVKEHYFMYWMCL